MLFKKIFYFSSATTSLAIGGPVVAYLTKTNAPTTVSQEATTETATSSSSQPEVSNDMDWGTWF